MPYTVAEAVQSMRDAHDHFLKHLQGVREDQLDWRPNAACKTIRETLAHLTSDYRAMVLSVKTGGEPDYDACQVAETDLNRLHALMAEEFANACALVSSTYTSVDDEACVFGWKMPLGKAIPLFCSEDYYHAGQVAFIRMATDPDWDYYGAVYAG